MAQALGSPSAVEPMRNAPMATTEEESQLAIDSNQAEKKVEAAAARNKAYQSGAEGWINSAEGHNGLMHSVLRRSLIDSKAQTHGIVMEAEIMMRRTGLATVVTEPIAREGKVVPVWT